MSSFGNGPKFLKGLKDAGAITSTLQAWYLSNDDTTQSYVELGGYTTTIIRSGETLQQFPLEDSFYWLGKVEGFRVGTTETLADSTVMGYYTAKTDVIYDTGTTLMYGPDSIVSTVVALLVKGVTSTTDSGYTIVKCSIASSMKSLFLYIDGRYLEVTPASYLLNVGTFSDGSTACAIGIVASGDSKWLVGDVFLKNFFSVWDDTNSKISFAPHRYTTSTIVTGAKPSTLFVASSSSSSLNIEDLLMTVLQYLLLIVVLYVGQKYGLECISTLIKNSKKS